MVFDVKSSTLLWTILLYFIWWRVKTPKSDDHIWFLQNSLCNTDVSIEHRPGMCWHSSKELISLCVCLLCMYCVCVLGRIENVFGRRYPRPCSIVWLSPSLCSSKGGGHTSMLEGTAGQGVKWRGCGERVRGTGGRKGRGLLSLHHSRTQQRQNLWRLPPTEGGGVTGAKYACTLMLGRWVLSLLMPARVICWQS